MPVNTPSSAYLEAAPKWARCRDTYEGADAVKSKGAKYLPGLDSHGRNPAAYAAYKMRALFYNAVARTVDGLAGGIFNKQPEFIVPGFVEPMLVDVTLTSSSMEMFALGAVREVLITGRFGILIDTAIEADAANRPYLAGYNAESIVSWRTSRAGGDEVLTRVVLREELELTDEADPFKIRKEIMYRVLELELLEGATTYVNTTYRQKGKDSKEFAIGPAPGETEARKIPVRRGTALDFIPFVFLSPTSVSPDVDKPPLLDLVDVNLSHYRTMADLEHGRHWTALPTPWVSGLKKSDGNKTLSIGSGKAWELDKEGRAGMLEFTGQGLGSLVTADADKRGMMATLGARLLESAPAAAETMGAVAMRHAGEHATLRSIAGVTEQGLTTTLQVFSWWAATGEAATAKDFEDVEAAAQLNRDFFAVRMSEAELRAWVMALQADKASFPTFYLALERGGLARPGVDFEQELADIERYGEAGTAPTGGDDITPEE